MKLSRLGLACTWTLFYVGKPFTTGLSIPSPPSPHLILARRTASTESIVKDNKKAKYVAPPPKLKRRQLGNYAVMGGPVNYNYKKPCVACQQRYPRQVSPAYAIPRQFYLQQQRYQVVQQRVQPQQYVVQQPQQYVVQQQYHYMPHPQVHYVTEKAPTVHYVTQVPVYTTQPPLPTLSTQPLVSTPPPPPPPIPSELPNIQEEEEQDEPDIPEPTPEPTVIKIVKKKHKKRPRHVYEEEEDDDDDHYSEYKHDDDYDDEDDDDDDDDDWHIPIHSTSHSNSVRVHVNIKAPKGMPKGLIAAGSSTSLSPIPAAKATNAPAAASSDGNNDTDRIAAALQRNQKRTADALQGKGLDGAGSDGNAAASDNSDNNDGNNDAAQADNAGNDAKSADAGNGDSAKIADALQRNAKTAKSIE